MRVFTGMGVELAVFSNAAGGMDPAFRAGTSCSSPTTSTSWASTRSCTTTRWRPVAGHVRSLRPAGPVLAEAARAEGIPVRRGPTWPSRGRAWRPGRSTGSSALGPTRWACPVPEVIAAVHCGSSPSGSPASPRPVHPRRAEARGYPGDPATAAEAEPKNAAPGAAPDRDVLTESEGREGSAMRKKFGMEERSPSCRPVFRARDPEGAEEPEETPEEKGRHPHLGGSPSTS